MVFVVLTFEINWPGCLFSRELSTRVYMRRHQPTSVIYVGENENENGVKRENKFVNEK